MSKKKYDVVELNKKENKILLEKKQNMFILFLNKMGPLFSILLLLIGIGLVSLSLMLVTKKLLVSEEPNIKDAKITVKFLDDISDVTMKNITPIPENTAVNSFKNNNVFASNGEILIYKKVEASSYIIYYFSDKSALKLNKEDNTVIRIAPINNEYGISDNGTINMSAKMSNINIDNIKDTNYGKITYFTDGSALITNSDIDMFVRNSLDIKENYISNNKVSYLKNTNIENGIEINNFYDGSMLINYNGTNYIVRNNVDLKTNGKNITFPNDNQATLIKSISLGHNIKIDYYSDGSAIIKNGSKMISVRKSNSIIIKNNTLIEIIDNVEVSIASTKDNTTYYTNGSATTKYNNVLVFVSDNSQIKYKDNNVNIEDNYKELTRESHLNNEDIFIFDDITIVTKDNKTIITNASNVIMDSDGYIKEIINNTIEDDKFSFTISNDTNEEINYRVVIESSEKTTLDTKYMRYILSYNNIYTNPSKLEDNIWKYDKLSEKLNLNGINYILLEKSLEAYQMDEISLMLWTDYETIPNSMMNKAFLGTIKVYSWINE